MNPIFVPGYNSGDSEEGEKIVKVFAVNHEYREEYRLSYARNLKL